MSKQHRFPFLGLLTLIWLGWGLTSTAAEPLPSLDDLLREYQTLGLPVPPRKAKLVRYEAGGGGIVDRKVQPKVYGLAFEVKQGTKTEHPFLLRGTLEWQPRWDPHTREVDPEPAAIKDLVVGPSDRLVLAIQCHERGWHKLATHLLERSHKKCKQPLRNPLLPLAWSYWEDHLTTPKIDRAPIAKRLKELIRQDKELDTESNRALLRSLDLALVPSKAKPGSIQAMIDDLVDYDADTGTMGFFRREDRYWRIARLGFDAVPALIEHLDDDRLTRARMIGFHNFGSWNLRVQDVVSDLLEDLAGQNVGRNWLRRQQGFAVQKAEAQKWWEQARKVGEETYLLDHVLPAKAKEGGRDQVERSPGGIDSVQVSKARTFSLPEGPRRASRTGQLDAGRRRPPVQTPGQG